MMINTPEGIAMFRLLSLRGMLSLECKGMKMSRGRSAYSVVKAEFGFKGNKAKVYEQLCAYIETLAPVRMNDSDGQ